jgi:hypothetical protein
MADIGINGSFVAKNQYTKIKDTARIDDEVLDISDLDKAKEEIESQDQSAIKYLKVSGGNYIKLNISNPEDISKLISELKASISNNPNLDKANFMTSFSTETGIKIADKFQYARSEVSLNLSKIIDLDQVMTAGDYNKEFGLTDKEKESKGFYARVEKISRMKLISWKHF